MCLCGSAHLPGVSRRHLLAGLAALAGAQALPRGAAAMPPAACFGPAELAGTPAERLARHATVADAVAEPPMAAAGSAVTGAFSGAVRRVDLAAGVKLVALTFDLCQTRGSIAGYDGAIVDYLRSQAVPATFFAGGLWLATHRKRAVELLADPLFQVGNHSWTHHDLHYSAAAAVQREILVTESALAEARQAARAACRGSAAVPAYRLFRFPYGSCRAEDLAAANAVGSVVIQWDVVSGDPDGTPAASIERAVLSELRPGSIVVMHANGRGTHTAEALRTLVPAIRAKGYRFVTVDALLAAGRPVGATTCYVERVGDTARYDNPSAFKATKIVKKPGALHTGAT